METLVLNATFEPVARVSWQRAITLVFAGKVEVVEEYEDKTVRSITFEIRMPSVVRFLKRLRRRRPVVKFSRENVYGRDHGRCQYCNKQVPRPESTYDHVTPRAHGGLTRWENVVIACVPCNQRKGGRTPQQAGMRLLTMPVKPTHLPEGVRFTFLYEKGMPVTWKTWLRDVSYWHGELEHE